MSVLRRAPQYGKALPPMRRLVLTTAVLMLCVSIPAGAAERGTIRGRIVNETTGGPQGGVRVELFGSTRDRSDSVKRHVITSADGTYRFENLRTGSDWLYVIDAQHDGGLFPGSPITIPSDTTTPPVIDTTLKVWDTTTDPESVIVRRDSMFAVVKDENVGIVQSVTIVNGTDLAYIGRGTQKRAGTSSTFGFSLPDGVDPRSVRIQDASIDVPRLVRTSFGFAVTIAIPPDETTIAFTYVVPGTAGSFDLSRTTLYPTVEAVTFAEAPLEIESPRFEPTGTVDIEGREYRRWVATDGFDAGDSVQVLAVATGAPSWIPFAAVGAGILVLTGAVLLLTTRRRKKPSSVPLTSPASDRDRLVSAIAALDLEFEAGGVSRDEWEQRRDELKTRLQEWSPVG